MSNVFTGLNISAIEAHLVYWTHIVSSYDSFFIGKKVPTQTQYVTLQNIVLKKRGRQFKQISDDGLTTIIGNHAEYTVRVTVYGDSCEEDMLKLENSLYFDTWETYFDTNLIGLAKTGSIKSSDSFNFTEFIPQSQMDIKFNIFVYNTETNNYGGYISYVEGELELDADNTDGTSESVTLDFTEDDT